MTTITSGVVIENSRANQKEIGDAALEQMKGIESSMGKFYEFTHKGVIVRCKTKERFREYKKLLLNDKSKKK